MFGGVQVSSFPGPRDPRSLDFAALLCGPLQSLYGEHRGAVFAEAAAEVIPGMTGFLYYPVSGKRAAFALVTGTYFNAVFLSGTSTLAQAAAQLAGWSTNITDTGTVVNGACVTYGDEVYNRATDFSAGFWNRAVLVIGHSYGGATAHYVSWLARRDLRPNGNIVYLTFGAPKAGNLQFGEELGAGGMRYFNSDDVVPILAPLPQQAPAANIAVGPLVALSWSRYHQVDGGIELSAGGQARRSLESQSLLQLQELNIVRWCYDSSSQSGLAHNLGQYASRLEAAYETQRAKVRNGPAPESREVASTASLVAIVSGPGAVVQGTTVAYDANQGAQELAAAEMIDEQATSVSLNYLAPPSTAPRGAAVPLNPPSEVPMAGLIPVSWRAVRMKSVGGRYSVGFKDAEMPFAYFNDASRAKTFCKHFNGALSRLLECAICSQTQFVDNISAWLQAAAGDGNGFVPPLPLGA